MKPNVGSTQSQAPSINLGVRPHSLVLGLIVSMLTISCDRPPSADGLAEWCAQDHDRTEENAKLRAGVQTTGNQPGQSDDTTLIEITWAQSCAQCHGAYGRGDGPQGPMVKAPDLTREEWQARTSDGDIEERIRSGKGAMPRFDSLPPTVVKGLVARIRNYRGAKEIPQ